MIMLGCVFIIKDALIILFLCAVIKWVIEVSGRAMVEHFIQHNYYHFTFFGASRVLLTTLG